MIPPDPPLPEEELAAQEAQDAIQKAQDWAKGHEKDMDDLAKKDWA